MSSANIPPVIEIMIKQLKHWSIMAASIHETLSSYQSGAHKDHIKA